MTATSTTRLLSFSARERQHPRAHGRAGSWSAVALVGMLAAAVLWMHVLAGSSTHHVVVLPDAGSGHGGPVTLLEGRPSSAGGTLSAHGDPAYAGTGLGRGHGTAEAGPGPVLSAGADAHDSGAGPLCLMVLVALVTLAARAALRRRAPWHPPGTAARASEDLRIPVRNRRPDLHALGISRT
ncbi:hypothetical protein [Cellulosimicrobium sp. E-16]|uniref:hypothetical protein n=1 Tax=Cellulosimicrobium sp. E-16 TaxID=3404049 RepID=UPI003CF27F90